MPFSLALMVKIICAYTVLLFLLVTADSLVEARRALEEFSIQIASDEVDAKGTRWAVLVAGSNGYENYRHQADICHAYQILKQGGLKDENIIVFMYDDIAYNEENPTPGFIVNQPYGPDVYHGVPKDYTGINTNVDNLYAVLLANKSGITGGSGKLLSSGPNDHVFFYYTDHGGTGILAMPVGDFVYAKDLMEVLKQNHKMKGYKKMAFYIEACESGSMVSGLLPDDIGIYTTTASKPDENSWGCYCPGDDNNDHQHGHSHHQFADSKVDIHSASIRAPSPAPGPVPAPAPTPPPPTPGSPDYYGTCLGDLYSVAWLEDSDFHDPRKETMKQQYSRVKKRTNASHVMQYGDMGIDQIYRSSFMGPQYPSHHNPSSTLGGLVITQRDAKLAYLNNRVQRAPQGSLEQIEAEQRVQDELIQRDKEDGNIGQIVKLLLGDKDGSDTIQTDEWDWECFKTTMRTYEEQCGALSGYGRKHSKAMIDVCNAAVNMEDIKLAITEVCS